MSALRWEDVLLVPDVDVHAEERGRLLLRAKWEAERVHRPRISTSTSEQVPLVTAAPLRSCSRCDTSRHSREDTCPCGGSWL